MVDLCITREELEKALEQLNIAHENGFEHSLVVIKLVTAGQSISDFKCQYDSLILQGHPTDQSLSWGRCWHPEWYKLVDGKCINV